jgi:predicted NBD/HSP70 family sugar kinase
MAEVVLRVRLMSGDQLDVRYEDDDADEDEVIQRVVDTLAEDSGVLRTTHGDRLMVLYGRGVAAVEMAPRGAVL